MNKILDVDENFHEVIEEKLLNSSSHSSKVDRIALTPSTFNFFFFVLLVDVGNTNLFEEHITWQI